jgi:hypothetical protein
MRIILSASGRLTLAATCAFAAASLFGARGAQAQVSVYPAVVSVSGAAPAAQSVTVQNAGTDEAQFRVRLMDYEQSPNGQHRFQASGAGPGTCGAGLRSSVDVLTLRGGESATVQLRFDEQDRSCWGVLLIERVSAGKGGFRVGQQVGVKVFRVASAAVLDGVVSDVRLRTEQGLPVLSFRFRNTGNAPLQATGEMELRDLAGVVVARAPIAFFSVLPGMERLIEVPLETPLAKGRYVAVPIVDFGAAHLAAGQGVIELSSR